MDAELNRVILDPDDDPLYKLLHELGKVELFCLIELLKRLKYTGEVSGYCFVPTAEGGKLHCYFRWHDPRTVLLKGAWLVSPARSWLAKLHDHVKTAQVVAALLAAIIAIGTFMSQGVASHLASPPASAVSATHHLTQSGKTDK